jgi:hypothetical protein
MVVTDIDLVSKLMALPAEAREELLGLLEDPEVPSAAETEEAILERLAETARHKGPLGKT